MSNTSKDFSTDNMKNTELYEYAYDFSVNYDSIDFDDILDIHKYLTIKIIHGTIANFFFFGLLTFFTLVRFSGSLYPYYKKSMKWVTLNN